MPSYFCNFLLISKVLFLPPKGQIYHYDTFRICINMISVGLIHPFEKFREVFICFSEFLISLLLCLPLSKPCQDAPVSSALIRACFPHWGGGPQFGSAIGTANWASEDPPYQGGGNLSSERSLRNPAVWCFLFGPFDEITETEVVLLWQ